MGRTTITRLELMPTRRALANSQLVTLQRSPRWVFGERSTHCALFHEATSSYLLRRHSSLFPRLSPPPPQLNQKHHQRPFRTKSMVMLDRMVFASLPRSRPPSTTSSSGGYQMPTHWPRLLRSLANTELAHPEVIRHPNLAALADLALRCIDD